MVELLAGAALVGLGGVGLATIVRALVPVRWLEQGIKPWSCDLCLSFWATAFCTVVAACMGHGTVQDAAVVLLSGFTIAYAVLQRLVVVPVEAPPLLPGDETSDQK